MNRNRVYGPTPTVAEPRRPLLLAVRSFVHAELIATPPIALWPQVVRSDAVPPDVDALLLTELEKERVGGDH
jgi:hypothetical protein